MMPMMPSTRAVRLLMIVGVATMWGGSAAALDPNTRDPRVILQAAFDAQTSPRSSARMKMTIRGAGGPRERVMSVKTERFADGRKTLLLIEGPPDMRNTGFLGVDYTDGSRADEQWLYLPKLHRVARVPNSGKADSFVGSDFSISDLTGQDARDFNLELIDASARVGEDECWVIEAIPRDDGVRAKTGYKRMEIWVSKAKLLPIQIKAEAASTPKTKYFKASEIRQVDGVWTPYKLQMRTLSGTRVLSETAIEVLSVDNTAKDVSDSDFTPQRLERGV
jgi:hypothetical protein